jgi:hypothetical protein
MATVTATLNTIAIPARVEARQPRRAEPHPTAKPTSRPGFWATLLRALAAPAA